MAHDACYIQWSLGQHGIPISSLLLCPVLPLDKTKLGIADRGVTILPRMTWTNGITQEVDASGRPIYDMFDVVGRQHYKYRADFYHEVCNIGLSRRIPRTANFDLLTPYVSVHYLCSNAGVIDEYDNSDIRNAVNMSFTAKCLKSVREHAIPLQDWFAATCTSMMDFEIAECDAESSALGWIRKVGKHTVYTCHPRKNELRYKFGAFMALPIRGFVLTTKEDDTLSKRNRDLAEDLQEMGFSATPVII